MKTSITVDDTERLARPRAFKNVRWKKGWMKMSAKLAQDRVVSLRSTANSISDAGSVRLERMSLQVQVTISLGLGFFSRS